MNAFSAVLNRSRGSAAQIAVLIRRKKVAEDEYFALSKLWFDA